MQLLGMGAAFAHGRVVSCVCCCVVVVPFCFFGSRDTLVVDQDILEDGQRQTKINWIVEPLLTHIRKLIYIH